MEILGFLSENWTVIGSTTILSTLLTKLMDKYFRKDEIILQSTLNKELESLKADLLAQNSNRLSIINQDLETLKSQLSIQNSRLQIAYSGIFGDQTKALKGLYTLVLEFETALNNRKNSSTNDPNIYINPLKVLADFKKLYYENAMFIPKGLDKKIMDILGFCFREHHSNLHQQAEEAAKNGNLEKANQLSMQAIENDLELYKLRDNFRDEIRSVLGLNV